MRVSRTLPLVFVVTFFNSLRRVFSGRIETLRGVIEGRSYRMDVLDACRVNVGGEKPLDGSEGVGPEPCAAWWLRCPISGLHMKFCTKGCAYRFSMPAAV